MRQHGRDPEVRRWLDAAALDIGGVVSDNSLVELLQQWIDEDRKHTALKALQIPHGKGGTEAAIWTGAAQSVVLMVLVVIVCLLFVLRVTTG